MWLRDFLAKRNYTIIARYLMMKKLSFEIFRVLLGRLTAIEENMLLKLLGFLIKTRWCGPVFTS